MKMGNHFVFILNPNAKNGQSLAVWKKVESELREKGVLYEVYQTAAPLHATKIVESVLEQPDFNGIIVAVGGDGTIHEVINGIESVRQPVTCLPVGSGSDFARGFHIPRKGKHFCKWLTESRFSLEAIDLGIFQIDTSSGKFVNNIGTGFDAVVAGSVNQSRVKKWFNKWKIGKLVYVYFLIKHLFTFKPTSAYITVDGQIFSFDKVWFLTVSNHPYFGGGMKISPASNPKDGVLEMTIVHDLTRWKLLFLFITVFWGGHTKLKEVTLLKGNDFYIETTEPQPIHADGEIVGKGTFHVQIKKAGLNLLKP
ncbi:YegS/Rv2252/BmrU family lipid kinase [Bacillus oleivorans]|uniref:YegS/Rv2252/BmrU family lipid kinase n=2 Tax=Bacillus oleivorans TaxID=1448271 RepID=A0A285CUT7_9BACI|nr:YegS/Rv2252/BmrU family lipid kinase [Bacillus oleivorans]